jgi:Uma2 family endonuclease
VTEFNHMGDMGWFEGRRAYLLDGVIWEDGPMDLPHTVALGLVQHALQGAFGQSWWVRGQSPLHVDQRNDPFPDFAVVPGGPRDYATSQPTTAALVVEIADTSLASDITAKAERYATAGIPEYWVLDLNNRRLLVFRDPQPLPVGLGATAYRTHRTLGPADTVAPLAAPNSPITVGDLLP